MTRKKAEAQRSPKVYNCNHVYKKYYTKTLIEILIFFFCLFVFFSIKIDLIRKFQKSAKYTFKLRTSQVNRIIILLLFFFNFLENGKKSPAKRFLPIFFFFHLRSQSLSLTPETSSRKSHSHASVIQLLHSFFMLKHSVLSLFFCVSPTIICHTT